MSDWERVEPGARLLTFDLIDARMPAAIECEIKPALNERMRDFYRRTGKIDDVDRVVWEGVDPANCVLVFFMESGEVHRIPFSLMPESAPH